jgi:hypothetical protein
VSVLVFQWLFNQLQLGQQRSIAPDTVVVAVAMGGQKLSHDFGKF